MQEIERLAANPMEALPENVKMLISGLMDGSIVQYALAFESDNGNVFTGFDNPGEGSRFTMLGAVATLHDDLMDQARRYRAADADD